MSHLLLSLSCQFILAFNAILLANCSLNKLRNKWDFLPHSPFENSLLHFFCPSLDPVKKSFPLYAVNFWRKNKVMSSHLHLRFVSCLLPGVLPVKTLHALYFPHASHYHLLRPLPSCKLIINILHENSRQWRSEHMSLSSFPKHIIRSLRSSRCMSSDSIKR